MSAFVLVPAAGKGAGEYLLEAARRARSLLSGHGLQQGRRDQTPNPEPMGASAPMVAEGLNDATWRSGPEEKRCDLVDFLASEKPRAGGEKRGRSAARNSDSVPLQKNARQAAQEAEAAEEEVGGALQNEMHSRTDRKKKYRRFQAEYAEKEILKAEKRRALLALETRRTELIEKLALKKMEKEKERKNQEELAETLRMMVLEAVQMMGRRSQEEADQSQERQPAKEQEKTTLPPEESNGEDQIIPRKNEIETRGDVQMISEDLPGNDDNAKAIGVQTEDEMAQREDQQKSEDTKEIEEVKEIEEKPHKEKEIAAQEEEVKKSGDVEEEKKIDEDASNASNDAAAIDMIEEEVKDEDSKKIETEEALPASKKWFLFSQGIAAKREIGKEAEAKDCNWDSNDASMLSQSPAAIPPFQTPPSVKVSPQNRIGLFSDGEGRSEKIDAAEMGRAALGEGISLGERTPPPPALPHC